MKSREQKRVYDAAYRAKHAERLRVSKAAYYAAHRAEGRVKRLAWSKANPERERARVSAWHAAHPERVRAYKDAWKADNPEAVHENWLRRRARQRNTHAEPITKAHLALLFEGQDGCCRYCRTPLGKDKHLDHRIPLARGGAHAPSNVCWSCPSCNLRKGARTEAEYLA
jgi:5-methylcytosine-specific restriction endonuclease McrA